MPEHLPMSFAQQRMWVLNKLTPKGGLYNMPLNLTLKGNLNLEALNKAFNLLIDRHESLRTWFGDINDESMQFIEEKMDFNIVCINLEHFSEEKKNELIAMHLKEGLQFEFDLSKLPLVMVRLLRLEKEKYILSMIMHHIITDGWSMNIIAKELGIFYNSFVQGKKAIIPDVKIQYADFTLWQREWLKGEILNKQLDYWKTVLHDVPEIIQLPFDKPRSHVRTYKSKVYELPLSSALSLKIKKFNGLYNITSFTFFLTAFQLLLHRYTGQKDVVTGSPIANRHYPDVGETVGFFVNSLAYRMNFDGDLSFLEVLNKTSEAILSGYENQDVPFDQIVDALQIRRAMDHNPIFQTWFMLEKRGETVFNFCGLEGAPVEQDLDTYKFDLSLIVTEDDNEFGISFVYSIDLFETHTIQRMAESLAVLTEGAISNPAAKIAGLPILPKKELARLKNICHTVTKYPKSKCIHNLFEAQVNKTPKSIALIYQEHSLTFDELNCKANQLAHYLNKKGVSRNTLVALSFERSIDFIIAILAILKNGAAYVPLDPALPSERLKHLLLDVQSPVLITESKFFHKYSRFNCECILLDSDWQKIAQNSMENIFLQSDPKDLAYVIYTSGSTGKPKGVLCHHLGILNRFYWVWKNLPFAENEVCCLQANVNFVDAVWEIFGPLARGVKLIIMPQGISKDPNLFVENLSRYGVTRLGVVPSLLAVLFEHYPNIANLLPKLRHLEISGEAVTKAFYERCAELLPSISIYDRYGSTEITSVIYKNIVLANLKQKSNLIISNTRCYILDKNLNPVPVGVAADLYLSGDGLAYGYFNQPEITNEKFISNPFIFSPDSKLFKTGDLARFLQNGDVEILGRNDHLVKVRGFRVEIGEMEAVIMRYDGIRNVCVIAREDEDKQIKITAFVVRDDRFENDDLFTQSLRSYIMKYLPEYAIPNYFCILKEMPVTANGKTNKEALLRISTDHFSRTNIFVPPKTEEEKLIADVWRDVLKLDQIGIDDNFFQIGGHSLLAVRLASRIQRIFDVIFPVKMVFDNPTISKQSAYLCKTKKTPTKSKIFPRYREFGEKLPLSFAQERLWFMTQYQGDRANYNIMHVVKLKGVLDIDAISWSLSQLIERHESLRTVFDVADGIPCQAVQRPIAIKVIPEEIDERGVDTIISEESTYKFDLSTGPLIRMRLLRVKKQEHVLLLNLHHIISDAWSFSNLCRDLKEYYNSKLESRVYRLPKLNVQYADYACWQKDHLRDQVMQGHFTYWRDMLQGYANLNLQTDYARPKEEDFAGAEIVFEVKKEVKNKLKMFAIKANVSVFMLLLAGFKILLAKLTQQDDILIGTLTANRNFPEVEDLIGFFVNTLPLRTKVCGNKKFTEFLAEVKQVCLDAYAHQELPFEKIVNDLKIIRDTSRHPLFQILFAQQNIAEDTGILGLNNIIEVPVIYQQTVSRFDFSIEMFESAESLFGKVKYKLSLFKEETIKKLIDRYNLLLANIVDASDILVKDINILLPEEKQLFLTWNETDFEYTWDVNISQLFEDKAKHASNAIAMVFENEQLTYSKLNAKANQLARYIREEYLNKNLSGFKDNKLIALCLDRSTDMIVSILAVLKAGAAYVPIDPNYPSERINYILKDTDTRLIITQEHLIKKLEPLVAQHTPACQMDNGRRIHNDRIQLLPTDNNKLKNKLSRLSERNLGLNSKPTDLAYVIYTSGTSGRPKGVMIEHRALCSFVLGFINKFKLSNIKLLSITNYVFDIFGLEYLLPLISIGTLYLATLESFKKVFVRYQSEINFLQQTPSIWRQLFDDIDTNVAYDIIALTGGEQLDLDVQKKLHKCFRKVFNVYGPTETTIWSTVHESNLKQLPSIIGKPLFNERIYILDSYLNRTPIGGVGELYIGGAGLARGYLNKSAFTVEKFISNPFMTKADEINGYTRIYKTGDLVRLLSDGSVEFVGRVDNQIKLRGHRIEPEEIEIAINGHIGVSQSIVVAEEENNQKYLIAYVKSNDSKIGNKLRTYLKKQLPDYMIPDFFVRIEAIPLTVNGKVSRNLLPKLNISKLKNKKNYIKPRYKEEVILTQIWSEVLDIERISVVDNFFELGGNSLLATKLVSRIQLVFGVVFPVKMVFECMTVREEAKYIQQNSCIEHRCQKINLVSRDKPLPLSFSQQRLWFIDQYEGGGSTYNVPFIVRLKGDLDITILNLCLNELIVRHESLRTIFINIQGVPYQKILSPFEIQLQIEIIKENILQKKVTDCLSRVFNLAEGPLIYANLLKIHANDHVIVINMHHIISDGWSVDILQKELCELYNSKTEGRQCNLRELPIQYADFAVWQRKQLSGKVLDEQLAYWKEYLRGYSNLELAFDYKRPMNEDHHGGVVNFLLDKDITKKLKRLALKECCSLYMILLAIFKVLLCKYADQDDITIGTTVAGRNSRETEGLVGFFVNTLPVRSKINRDASFLEFLKEIKGICLEVQSHQDIPFEKLVDEIGAARNVGRNPIFQVVFEMHNYSDFEKPTIHKLLVEYLDISNFGAKFDLNFAFIEAESQIIGNVIYKTSLFKAETINKIVNYFVNLLESILFAPSKRIKELEVLSSEEKSNYILGKNYREYKTDFGHTFISLFEAQAQKNPNAIAIRFKDKTLTYLQLNSHANYLANYLNDINHIAEKHVAIFMDRSDLFLVGMLGILKSGGAYVPLLPSHPEEKHLHILSLLNTRIVITEKKYVSYLKRVAPKHELIVLDN
ncbi:MAG: amino acid adenylation domain-containing protein, partial [Actinobacteria bacterium]|nr:amino acid adenylation domain-containing protein [Actinomycetota bacterium]